jgi:hypothetical protein
MDLLLTNSEPYTDGNIARNKLRCYVDLALFDRTHKIANNNITKNVELGVCCVDLACAVLRMGRMECHTIEITEKFGLVN